MTKKDGLIQSAETVSLFCRLNINAKKNIPIRSSEMGLLILTVKNEQPVTPVMAAEFFKVKKPMIAAMVSSLIQKGYIAKKPSQTDKRSFTLSPTAKAITLVEQTHSEYIKTLELIRVKLGNGDFDNLINLLEKTNTILLEEKTNG
jgi:DNA-binding MarR family transcriptional regulator